MSSPTPRLEPATGPPNDLAGILRAARAGERGAFARLYERFARTVHGIVLAAAGPDDAEDLTQEVFLVVQRRIDTVADDAALPGWICAIARNAAVDAHRRRQKGPRLVELPELPARDERRDEAVAEHVLRRVRELPDAYRETLVLRLVEGLSGPEIAARTGMTHGSVRVNLHRGLAMLREVLRKDGWP